jgi:hypothetical protein
MQLGDGALGGARIYGAQAAETFRTPMTSLPPEAGGWAGGFTAFPPLPGGFRSYGVDAATLSFYSSMRVSPELDLGVFVSANTDSGGAMISALFPLVVQKFYGPPPAAPLAGRPEKRAEMAAYAGQYRTTQRRYGGLEGFVMRLGAAQPVLVSPDGYLTVPLPSGPLRFIPTEEPGRFANADRPGVAVFERRRGRMTILTYLFASERLGPLETPETLFFAAALAALAAFAAIVGLCMRAGRGLPKTPLQGPAGLLQTAAAALWLASFASAGAAAAGVGDGSALYYDWPTAAVLAFSTLALVASVVSAGVVALLPVVWTGRGGWSGWRKSRFTLTAALFAACGALLLSWGALQPWNP